ncbi:hypothetical protein COOONC_02797, partial [Cooperia oncophora]
LHFIASLKGATVVRPLFYEFPTDKSTYNISYQFLWGRSMLIAPVVYERAKSVTVYLPEDDWYSLYDFQYGQLLRNGFGNYTALTELIPVFVRGESILPRQAPSLTTSKSRNNAFELLIAPAVSSSEFAIFLFFLTWRKVMHPYLCCFVEEAK